MHLLQQGTRRPCAVWYPPHGSGVTTSANDSGRCPESWSVSLEICCLNSLAYAVAYGIGREDDIQGCVKVNCQLSTDLGTN